MSTSEAIRVYVGRAFLTLLVVSLLILSMHPAAAQTDRATLEGTITDPSGGTIAGASVNVTEVATGISQIRKTNSHGYYFFPGLAVGEYTISVSNPGFKSKNFESVILQVGETRTFDVRLTVGEVDEEVEVEAEANPLERTSAASATVISTNQIANLPVNGRDWSGLTLLAPFAQDDGGGDQRTIRFAGRARDDNNFNFDGVDAGGIQEQAQKSQVRLQISEDAVEEYRVNSALYDAEYGTQAGGQINVVTKSGGNDFHGTLFGYFRNSIFDARNFNDGTPDPITGAFVPTSVLPFRMGQYGLTFGGPIQKDKTFFFISYEGLRQLQQDTSNGTIFVPSASFVQDILVNGRTVTNNGTTTTFNPTPQMCAILQGYPWRASTGTVAGCAPKVVFPDSFFSNCSLPAANCGLQLGPNDMATDIENFTHPIQTTVHEDTWLVRSDHKFSDKTTLYGRAQRDISLVNAQIGVTGGLDDAATINHPANYLLALQHVFTSNIFNETKFYINRSPFNNPPYFDYFGSAAGDPKRGYYSYDLGAWHIIALNGECKNVGGCQAGSSEEQWLRQDLQSHSAACTLAYWHEPRFSSGAAHGNDADFIAFWQDLYSARATVVLNGHDHDYERFAPQDPDGKADPARGIREFVVGTDGNHERTFAASPDPNSEVRMTGMFGVLKLTLHAHSYDWEFIPEAGKSFQDSGNGNCH